MRIRDGSQGWQTAVRNGKTDEAPWKKYEDEMAKRNRDPGAGEVFAAFGRNG
jgi:hypothetical protein